MAPALTPPRPITPAPVKRIVPSGIIPVDKPSGPTSHDVVEGARRLLGTQRVGHCGTLDPAASGLLILAVEDALKQQEALTGLGKSYSGQIRLGMTAETDDMEGTVTAQLPADSPLLAAITEDQIAAALALFRGEIDQEVPRYSAVKVNGRKMYEWARDGMNIPLPVRRVTVDHFELVKWENPFIHFRVSCSKGTYVRSLARDVGAKLGTGGLLASLRRLSIGALTLDAACAWGPAAGLSADKLLSHLIPQNQIAERLGAAPKKN
jgi:tRNA pseudouridine55 synthase